MASDDGRTGGHDRAALDEIELAGELMIAASASTDDRLATERIDQVLLHGRPPDRTPPDQTPPDQTPPDQTPPDQTPPDRTPPDQTPTDGPADSAN